MAIAEVNNDHADALLLNRIAYYGIGVAVPYILMRHWEEWEKSRTITFDDTDHRLCELVMNIQYRTQQHWFGSMPANTTMTRTATLDTEAEVIEDQNGLRLVA